MFAVVPKTLWNRTTPADDNNRISTLPLVFAQERRQSINFDDTGMGNKTIGEFFLVIMKWGVPSNGKISKKITGFHNR